MNKFILFSIAFVFFIIVAIEGEYYAAAFFGFLGSVVCLADLKPLGQKISNNRGMVVGILGIVMILFIFLKL